VYLSNAAKTKIQEDVRCEMCDEPARLKRLKVNGKLVPDWWVVANNEKLTVRCKKCKRDRLYLIEAKFVRLLTKNKHRMWRTMGLL
jgi:predicted nucleic-acid-binding Zn-ribbon protein